MSRSAAAVLLALSGLLAAGCGARGPVEGRATGPSPSKSASSRESGSPSASPAGAPSPKPSATKPAATPATRPAAPSAAPAAPLRATDDMPVLALERVCYGECGYWPEGLSRIAVYSDGSVALADRVETGDEEVVRVARLVLPADEIASLQAAARAAGLDAGGVHRAGTTRFTDDGAGSVFFARSGTAATVVEAPHLYDHASIRESDGDPGQRAALLALQQRLQKHAARAEARTVQPHGYVILARPDPQDYEPVGEPLRWPGPRPLSAYAERVGQARCAIVPAGHASREAVAAFTRLSYDTHYVSGGRSWSAVTRPLMPHERSCADVEAWRAAQAAGLRDELRAADDPDDE